MKKNSDIFYILTFIAIALGMAVTAIYIGLMPDTVPAHYNFAGEVDRWGSKYENLIFIAINLVFGLSFLAGARYYRKKSDHSSEKVMTATAFGVTLLFSGMSWYFCHKALNIAAGEGSGARAEDIYRFCLIAIGLLLVIMGNLMPKLKKNRFIGLRTSWSMANEAVWQKSQRFGGYITIAFGLAMLLCAAFLSGTAALIALLIAAPVWAAACILGSRRIYKRETAEKGE